MEPTLEESRPIQPVTDTLARHPLMLPGGVKLHRIALLVIILGVVIILAGIMFYLQRPRADMAPSVVSPSPTLRVYTAEDYHDAINTPLAPEQVVEYPTGALEDAMNAPLPQEKQEMYTSNQLDATLSQ